VTIGLVRAWVREREQRQRERERAGLNEGERREESFFFIIRIMKGTATVFHNALGNIVDTLGLQLKIGLLL
jgi:hypothetical protein